MDEKHYLNDARVQHNPREVYDGEYTYHTKGGRHTKRKCVYQMITYRMYQPIDMGGQPCNLIDLKGGLWQNSP